jgi:hypothetical protein
MRRLTLRVLSILVLILTSAPAYAQKITYDWDKDVDFTPYRTYQWIDPQPGKSPVETTHKRIVSNVNGQLQAKNFQKTAAEKADLLISYQVVSENNGQVTSFNPDGQWQPGPGMTSETAKPVPGSIRKGSLVIDVYDPKLKRLIWRGIVSGDFESRQAVNYQIDKGLSKLFIQFPPRPTK